MSRKPGENPPAKLEDLTPPETELTPQEAEVARGGAETVPRYTRPGSPEPADYLLEAEG
jgi:hypothetical protein